MIATLGARGKSTFGAQRRSILGARETYENVLYDRDHRTGKIRKRDVMDLSVGEDVATVPFWHPPGVPDDPWYYRDTWGQAGDDTALWLLQRHEHADAQDHFLVELSLLGDHMLRDLSDVLPPIGRPNLYIMGGDSDVLYVARRPAGTVARLEPSTMALSEFTVIANLPGAGINSIGGDGDTLWVSTATLEQGHWIYHVDAQTWRVLQRFRPPGWAPATWSMNVATVSGGSSHLFLYEIRQQQIMEPPFTNRRWTFTLYRYNLDDMTVAEQLRTVWTSAVGDPPGDEFVLGLVAN